MSSVNFAPPTLGQITDDPRYNERNGLALSATMSMVSWHGFGVPSNTLGGNSDQYWRLDGGAGTTIYQKRAGAWVATGA